MAHFPVWTKPLGWAAGAALLALLGAASAWSWAIAWYPSSRTYAFQGVDVSEDNGPIEWATVRARGADFAYIRASYGSGGRDSRFADNWTAVAQAGMRRGAYHSYSLCRTATDQANGFNIVVPRTDDALPAAVFLDFAPDCADRPDRTVLLDELRRFIAMVEAHTGKPILLRVSRRFEKTYSVSSVIDRTYWAVGDFFVPRYTAQPWRMWQASDLRRVDGIEGPVNWDVVAP